MNQYCLTNGRGTLQISEFASNSPQLVPVTPSDSSAILGLHHLLGLLPSASAFLEYREIHSQSATQLYDSNDVTVAIELETSAPAAASILIEPAANGSSMQVSSILVRNRQRPGYIVPELVRT